MIIETQGLTKTYRMGTAEVHALRDVSLNIEAGEFVALTGPSGSGKSTMMHLLGCLDTPTAGHYYLQGRDVSGLASDERAWVRNTQIGFVFQTFNLLPRLDALDNVALPILYRRSSGNARTRAAQALDRVGLGHRATHHPAEMSGGERQRVALARALVADPVLILADEPTGNLDSKTGAQILSLLEELCAEGRTILIVTHDPQVASHAQRIVRVQDGQIVN